MKICVFETKDLKWGLGEIFQEIYDPFEVLEMMDADGKFSP
jgi:hypothetical protein